MDHLQSPEEFVLPLELQFAMRKAEIHAQDMTWDELYCALLNLYQQRLLEIHSLQSMLAEEGIELDYDVPTDIEIMELTAAQMMDDDDDDNFPAAFM